MVLHRTVKLLPAVFIDEQIDAEGQPQLLRFMTVEMIQRPEMKNTQRHFVSCAH